MLTDTERGLAGKIRWHEDHPPTVEQYGHLLDDAVAISVLRADDHAELSAVTPIEDIAAMRALLATTAQQRTQ